MSLTGKTTGGNRVAQTDIPHDAIRTEVEAVVGSSVFAGSDRLIGFLRYIVDEALDGRGDRLKEYAIALAVFDQSETFDPQTNTIVRVQAGRLRRRLEMYYLTDGVAAAVHISVPKGGYVPLFEQRQAAVAVSDSPSPATVKPLSATDNRTVRSSPSIAVLPFENYSGDPGDQFVADGITEEVIANLARFKDLFVFSRSTTAKLVQDGADIRQLRDELGVDFVIEGSVRKSGQMVRVTVQLIDASSDGHVFAESFDRPCTPEQIFEIQDEIALLVAGRVADRYGPLGRYVARARRAGQSKEWETYSWILRFYDYYATHNPETHLDVREGLARALENDPDSSDGWAASSVILIDEYRFHFNERPSQPVLDDALQHALRAVSTDPENAFAYQALAVAYFHRREFTDFRLAAERALELNPGHSDVLADIGTCYSCLGDWDQGLQLLERATELSPVHPGWYHVLRTVHHLIKNDLEAAATEIRQAFMPGFFWYHAAAVCVAAKVGDKEMVAGELNELLTVYPNFAQNALLECQIWSLHDALVETLVSGWRKAGLDVA